MSFWDYDNGMLNKLQLSHTHSGSSSSAGSHRHGTIGDNPTTPYLPDYPQSVIDGLRSRFGWYSTSKGVGLRIPWDYDNGMLNKRPTHSHFTQPAAMAPLARIQITHTALHKPLDPALAFTAQAKALAWGMRRFQVFGTMITACKHKQPLSRSHGTIGENPDDINSTHTDLKSRFGFYSTSKGIGMAVTLDYDNGMLNTSARALSHSCIKLLHTAMAPLARFTTSESPHTETLTPALAFTLQAKALAFLVSNTTMITACYTQAPALSHSNHGTIGEVYDLREPVYRDLNSRFGFYTTSRGVGLRSPYDYDNGMLNTTSDDVPLTLTCPY